MNGISILLDRDKIRTDGGTQARTEINEATVREYAETLRQAAVEELPWPFPDVIVFYDGENYWLGDGFHRVNAAKQAEYHQVSAEVRQGTRRDAVLFAVGANATHGLRRSQADKRRAIETLLRDDEWGRWSDREIARRCNVSHPTVAAIRAEVTGNFSSERVYVDKHGNETRMETASIGKKFNQGKQAELNMEAKDWLANYRDEWGRTWQKLEENQVHHANSPCYQAFVRAFSEKLDGLEPKHALKTALWMLRQDQEEYYQDMATETFLHDVAHPEEDRMIAAALAPETAAPPKPSPPPTWMLYTPTSHSLCPLCDGHVEWEETSNYGRCEKCREYVWCDGTRYAAPDIPPYITKLFGRPIDENGYFVTATPAPAAPDEFLKSKTRLIDLAWGDEPEQPEQLRSKVDDQIEDLVTAVRALNRKERKLMVDFCSNMQRDEYETPAQQRVWGAMSEVLRL